MCVCFVCVDYVCGCVVIDCVVLWRAGTREVSNMCVLCVCLYVYTHVRTYILTIGQKEGFLVGHSCTDLLHYTYIHTDRQMHIHTHHWPKGRVSCRS